MWQEEVAALLEKKKARAARFNVPLFTTNKEVSISNVTCILFYEFTKTPTWQTFGTLDPYSQVPDSIFDRLLFAIS
jgi:hypothetical protein